MKYHSKTISVLLLALMLLGGAASVAGQELWHVINADRYRRMSQFERVQYDKAFNLKGTVLGLAQNSKISRCKGKD